MVEAICIATIFASGEEDCAGAVGTKTFNVDQRRADHGRRARRNGARTKACQRRVDCSSSGCVRDEELAGVGDPGRALDRGVGGEHQCDRTSDRSACGVVASQLIGINVASDAIVDVLEDPKDVVGWIAVGVVLEEHRVDVADARQVEVGCSSLSRAVDIDREHCASGRVVDVDLRRVVTDCDAFDVASWVDGCRQCVWLKLGRIRTTCIEHHLVQELLILGCIACALIEAIAIGLVSNRRERCCLCAV